MSDQAEMLRKIVDRKNSVASLKQDEEVLVKNARVITVTSGKGGVGKTNVTVNLAIALSRQGYRVVILDVDFGLANIDVLLGVISKHTILDLIHDDKEILDILAQGPENIKFLSGGSGMEELIHLDRKKLRKFVMNIALLDKHFDFILIDTGAGLSPNVMSFIMAADEIILVTTPEPTSITDAYALVKTVSRRDKKKKIHVVVNRVESPKEADEIIRKLTAVSEKFLSLKLLKLGYILYDDSVIRSVKQQKPFSLENPRGKAARNIADIARTLIGSENLPQAEGGGGAKGFIAKLLSFF